MNRSELTTAVARATEQPATVVDKVFDELEAQLLELAAAGTEVKWPGLFTLDVVQRPERSGRNPQTGEPMTIPAGRQARLKVGTRLKRAVHGA